MIRDLEKLRKKIAAGSIIIQREWSDGLQYSEGRNARWSGDTVRAASTDWGLMIFNVGDRPRYQKPETGHGDPVFSVVEGYDADQP